MNGYGVDFGTTNSVAAVCNGTGGRVRAYTDLSNNLPHPSVVWYRGDEIVVGKEAKRNLKGYADVTGNAFVGSVKRKLGHDYVYSVLGERKAAWQIASDVFRFLRTQAKQSYTDEIENAVVTVPVYYDGRARAELRKAANAAGMEIKTFIHEPFAAVVGYCYSSGIEIENLNGTNIMVFDWGGGTLDITIARVKDGRIFEVATAGLKDIAGDYFDIRLEKYARARFLDRYGLRDDVVSLLPGTKARFGFECEQAKIRLSSAADETVSVARFFEREGRDYDLNEPITRSEFDQLIKDDMQAAMRQVDKAIDEASLTAQEIDTVLLIGGTSRIPALRKEMLARFGRRAIDIPNADTIIAEGASVISYHDWLPYLVRPIQVRLSDGSLYTIFEEGRVLKAAACRKDINFYCTDNRDGEARMVLVEPTRAGDSSSVRVKDVLSVPVNSRLSLASANERVTASFEIDEDLTFHVSAWGAIDESVASLSIHDLCFGIRVE
jgi:molecular chaperone DnaK (HSP70)